MIDSHPVKVLASSDGSLDAHPFDFQVLGLAGVIDRLADRLRRAGLDVSLEVGHAEAEVDRRTAILLYRATCELFGNILARAGARHVRVFLQVEPGSIQIRVADDGPAFQGVETVSGEAAERGLQKLHRVIGLSGGYTDVQSGPETGTCVTVHLPTG